MCNMLQHLIVLHIIFACMESNDSPVCIQMLHHRANEVDGIIYGEDRAMAISASMVPKKAEDDVDMLPTVVLPDDGRFIDILGKRLSSNASSHPGFFLVLLCFRRLLIAEPLKHVCQPVQMAAFEGFSSNKLVYVFAFPSECALTP